MTIRALIFDLGGVLVRYEDLTLYRRWEERLGLAEGDLVECVLADPVADLALVGRATVDDLWEAIGKKLALPPDELDALRADFWRVGVWDSELLDYIRSLRPRYKTGLISDAFLDAREEVQEHVNDSLFDVIVFSAEEGVRKPDPEIYVRALARLGVAPQEAVFCDDRPLNVEGARRVGIHAFQFTTTQEARAEIERLINS